MMVTFRHIEFLAVFIFCLIWKESAGQLSPQWNGLKKGPFSVGFKTIQETDFSRRYFSEGRPINLYIWYPAKVASHAPHMKFADYFEAASLDWGNDPTQKKYLNDYFV